jgi:hypothetical protein
VEDTTGLDIRDWPAYWAPPPELTREAVPTVGAHYGARSETRFAIILSDDQERLEQLWRTEGHPEPITTPWGLAYTTQIEYTHHTHAPFPTLAIRWTIIEPSDQLRAALSTVERSRAARD